MDEPHGRVLDPTDARCSEIRRCAACGAESVTVESFSEHPRRSPPTGRTYFHVCGGCGVTLRSTSTLRFLRQLLQSVALMVAGAFVLFATEVAPPRAFVLVVGPLLVVAGVARFAFLARHRVLLSRNPIARTFKRDG